MNSINIQQKIFYLYMDSLSFAEDKIDAYFLIKNWIKCRRSSYE